jgi:hypothetical protein
LEIAISHCGNELSATLRNQHTLLAGGVVEEKEPANQGTLFSLSIAPQIQATNGSPGLGSSFGFGVIGYSNQTVVIEASTNFASRDWIPLQTNIIGTASDSFTDFTSTNFSCRFYRLRVD